MLKHGGTSGLQKLHSLTRVLNKYHFGRINLRDVRFQNIRELAPYHIPGGSREIRKGFSNYVAGSLDFWQKSYREFPVRIRLSESG